MSDSTDPISDLEREKFVNSRSTPGTVPIRVANPDGTAISGGGEQLLALDYDGNNNPIYIGVAAQGSAKSAAVWQIRKLTYSGTNPTDIQYANGSTSYNAIWDNRASLNYG